jgi:hypothetical protein
MDAVALIQEEQRKAAGDHEKAMQLLAAAQSEEPCWLSGRIFVQ